MVCPRVGLLSGILAIAVSFPVSAQTVISTHSGTLYFFEGTVYLGDQRVEQRFGKFPDIGEGNELRTAQGRAEVLLTPGVFLRINDNSAIRMVSEQLSDTRVELLNGSAIMEVNQNAPNTSVTLLYKQWQIKAPDSGVYRVDTDPARICVYRGQVSVSADGKSDPVTVTDNQNLPLAAVLVPEPAPITGGDAFKAWAMNRSQAVSADNAIASEILDDPDQMDTASGLDAGGYTYFPLTGVPSLGINNPYGVSFWSPYQAGLNALYFPSYLYTPFYPGWPTGIIIYPRLPSSLFPGRSGNLGLRPGLIGPRPIGGVARPSYTLPSMRTSPGVVRPAVVRPMAAPHPVVGRR